MSPTRLYFGGIPESVGEDDLVQELSEFGEIVGVKVLTGFAFVDFTSEKGAADIVDALHGRVFLGRRISVEFARPSRNHLTLNPVSPVQQAPRRLVPAFSRSHSNETQNPYSSPRLSITVSNLPRQFCWQELKDLGRSAGGQVIFCDLNRRERGQGYIEYSSREDAENAIRVLEGKVVAGNMLRVSAGKPSQGPNRNRSRSPQHREVMSHLFPRVRTPPRHTNYTRATVKQLDLECAPPHPLETDAEALKSATSDGYEHNNEPIPDYVLPEGEEYERYMHERYERDWREKSSRRQLFRHEPSLPASLAKFVEY